eukprot:14320367-Ditylum_brightwellii.AAC.1
MEGDRFAAAEDDGKSKNNEDSSKASKNIVVANEDVLLVQSTPTSKCNTYTFVYVSRILGHMPCKCKCEPAGNITSTSSPNRPIKIAITTDLPSQ